MGRQTTTAVVLMMMLCTLSVYAGPQARLSAKALLGQVDTDGAKTVLWRLWDDKKSFEQVMDGIESGDKDWLALAAKFRPVSDAGATESLYISVSAALARVPERVLEMTGAGFPIDDVCTDPRIEVTKTDSLKYLRRT